MTTLYEKIYQISGGNPGAISVIAQCFKLTNTPEEQSAILSALEHVGWQGSDIWVVFKDEAKQDLAVFLELLTKAAIASQEVR